MRLPQRREATARFVVGVSLLICPAHPTPVDLGLEEAALTSLASIVWQSHPRKWSLPALLHFLCLVNSSRIFFEGLSLPERSSTSPLTKSAESTPHSIIRRLNQQTSHSSSRWLTIIDTTRTSLNHTAPETSILPRSVDGLNRLPRTAPPPEKKTMTSCPSHTMQMSCNLPSAGRPRPRKLLGNRSDLALARASPSQSAKPLVKELLTVSAKWRLPPPLPKPKLANVA